MVRLGDPRQNFVVDLARVIDVDVMHELAVVVNDLPRQS